jgi:hypothetical protein
VDAFASLRPFPVDVELTTGWVYTIPALPAADWIEAVLTAEGGALFPGLLRDGEYEAEVWQALTRGELPLEEMVSTARAALSAAAGRDWWVADRLIRSAMHDSTRANILGGMVRSGLDVTTISLAMFCDSVLSYVLQNADEGQRFQLEAELGTPPPEATEEELMGDEEEYEAEFLATVGDRGHG